MGADEKRRGHHSYDEEVDEPARTIEDEAGDIEAETPALENEPVEESVEEPPPETPAFEQE